MTRAESERLVVTLPSDLEIVMTRSFAAPAARVFEAFTNPEHVRNWWGWRTSTPVVFEGDVRPGGTYRYVARDLVDGQPIEVGFHGEYLEVDRPSRVVYTEVFEGMEGNSFPSEAAVGTVTFEEHLGRTTVVSTWRYPSKEVRDLVIESGMEEGAAVSYDRLEELLAALAGGETQPVREDR